MNRYYTRLQFFFFFLRLFKKMCYSQIVTNRKKMLVHNYEHRFERSRSSNLFQKHITANPRRWIISFNTIYVNFMTQYTSYAIHNNAKQSWYQSTKTKTTRRYPLQKTNVNYLRAYLTQLGISLGFYECTEVPWVLVKSAVSTIQIEINLKPMLTDQKK